MKCGTFFLYNLSRPNTCDIAYCFGKLYIWIVKKCMFLLNSDPVINCCFIIQTGENEICSKPGKFTIIWCMFNDKQAYCVEIKKIILVDWFLKYIYCKIYNSDPCNKENRLILPVSGDRSTSCKDQSLKLCDSVLRNSWYRPMKNNVDVKMASSCVDRHSCGTEQPIWLKGIAV